MDKPITLPPSEVNMVDVGEKPTTHRHSCAEGFLNVGTKALDAIQNQNVPKGDMLTMAEIAGVLAAKNTATWIPLCHPIPIDVVRIKVTPEISKSRIQVVSFVSGFAKTGFEMEALTAVSAALLCLYDCLKGIEPSLEISEIHLTEKSGGKSGRLPATRSLQGISIGVLTVSDRVSKGEAEDVSGKLLRDFFVSKGAERVECDAVCDEKAAIQKAVTNLVKEKSVRVVVTTGGTGLGPRDVTPEAVFELIEKEVPGISERLRSRGAAQTENACLSRSVVGVFQNALILCLPGSRHSVEDSLFLFENIVPHALHIMDGGKHG